MKLTRLILAFSAAIFAAACFPPTTKTPIGTTAGFKPDPALYGMWRAQDGDKSTYFAFLKNDDNSMTAVFVSPPTTPEGSGDWGTYGVEVTKLGDTTFLNARVTSANGHAPDPDESEKIVPLLYRVSGRTLKLSFMDEATVREAIAKGKLKGSMDPGENGDVHITEDGPKLDALMQTPAGLGLFVEKNALLLQKVD